MAQRIRFCNNALLPHNTLSPFLSRSFAIMQFGRIHFSWSTLTVCFELWPPATSSFLRILFPLCWFWTAFLQQPSASTFPTAVPSTCTFSAFIRGTLGICFPHSFTFTQYTLIAQENAVQYPVAFPQHTKLPQQYFSSVGSATYRSRSFTLFPMYKVTNKSPNTLQWHNSAKRRHNMVLHTLQNADQPFSMQVQSLLHLMLVRHAPTLACDVFWSLGDHASRCISSRLRHACMRASL